ncbi:proteasome activator subunit 3 (PA28 gamma) [Mytilus galloprovincialis]|uniref:Proteasome activator subunit 3 (PA28 gamma) n=1 Tax=Mytilus galloprovincialis TaxID=29158 RepID=A0A8B6DUQ9_MYTGA|nr:proteasome activator subunit 3 (PA28 gamma) [Mytilus galloprovincialis]
MPTDGKKSAKQREELEKKVEDFKEKFKTDGDHLVHHVFPSKILELEDIYQSLHVKDAATYHTDLNIPVPDPVLFYNNDTSEPERKRKKLEHNNDDKVEDIAGTKVQILPNGPVPCNKRLAGLADQIKPYIQELIDHANIVSTRCNKRLAGLADQIKPYIQELIDHANILKMWITLLIPKIEDGNNFGVSVQEDTLGEARQVESEAASYLDQISRYYITRAKLVSKVAKYPHLDDYRQSVRELDEKEFISIRLISCELRNHYASLHDIILKNMEKIKKPKNDNAHQNLY